jgi:LPXTG-motif cell wall-anchored protein
MTAGAGFAVPAYPAPDAALACSATTFVPASAFTCTVGGPVDATVVFTVTTTGVDAVIAGAQSSTKTIGASNVATFTVTAPAGAGNISVSATVNKAATNTKFTVFAADPASGLTSGLARTGADNSGLAIAAGGLLFVGAGAVVFAAARRRRSS